VDIYLCFITKSSLPAWVCKHNATPARLPTTSPPQPTPRSSPIADVYKHGISCIATRLVYIKMQLNRFVSTKVLRSFSDCFCNFVPFKS
jgi:hypothetical protein